MASFMKFIIVVLFVSLFLLFIIVSQSTSVSLNRKQLGVICNGAGLSVTRKTILWANF